MNYKITGCDFINKPNSHEKIVEDGRRERERFRFGEAQVSFALVKFGLNSNIYMLDLFSG